ncbi:MAG TPA: ABC transporter ATP-binding protein [Microthrixaceae bacterium]|nr:ABC transporter ATP-binding protein [Microthrixaceae bacterium]HNA36996.1 ABC transporter ATP-binding protein [Microthrixaceae bacterium]HNB94221.1 ABC transporter ATP-binding protein [Microthrixaceae bacterium]HNE36778.1 ABC transporter ATP-binding protein [Microthrixaceae bacterium]HNG24003.1 ABC transporter ATP-binding protein [Microthrixaceae bacterium]
MTEPAVLLEGIRVAFPDGPDERVVLDDLKLSVDPGELVVISGQSGAGKSTLLAVTGLLRRADAGEVTIAGTATSAMSSRQRTAVRRDHIAFVYQSANLLPSLTAVEQLELVGHIRGERSADVRRRARGLLDELGLADRASQLPSQLSGGERQRVGIARAFMAEPSVLIADEPTASLDPQRADSVAELLAGASARGIATIVVAHDTAALSRADRHLRMEDGRLLDVGG